MAVPKGYRFEIPFDVMFPNGLFLIGEIQPLTEYQSQEDRARNRPVRPRTDEDGLLLFKGMFADPSAEKDRDKSVSIEFAAKVQPVPPASVPGVPFTPVVLEGLTVQPRAEATGQAKWVIWSIRATGMRAVETPATGRGGKSNAANTDAPKSAAA
ncbi:hypothetical protein LWC34_06310 [Kibdelosporangium philippinense]|uniref:Plasmid replication, integration and excision activator n=2 Tax=Kibdelosporangium philippinense TaxID=211113 RepID=A0ABS8Z3Q7_9PSEU|nr:hypothetical protein [Kibdelosporangium philippinense]MCE7002445.1 hypothetical protein [Kibdelosporangium philippinense]